MIPVEEFEKENQEIIEICVVLRTLVKDHALRTNTIVCDLMGRFMDRVEKHIAHEDRIVYGDLLAQHTAEADKLASHFLGNTQELKRITKSFKKDWCQTPHNADEHDKYIDGTMDIFKLVCDRIEFETNKIFPFLAKIYD